MKNSIFLFSAMLTSSVFSVVIPASAAQFSYDNILPLYFKLDTSLSPEDVVDGYIEKYRPEVWRKYRNDEFEMESKRTETVSMLKEKIEKSDLATIFTINTSLEFGEYDFKEQKFALKPFEESSYFSVDYCCNSLPRNIYVFFNNANIIDGIPMLKDKAKAFLNSRKESYGSVNRKVYAKIDVLLKDSPSREKINSEIRQVVIFDKDNKTILHKISID